MNSIEIGGYTIFVGDRATHKIDGEEGRVVFICDCIECNKRGWHDITIYLDNGETDYISSEEDYKNWDIY